MREREKHDSENRVAGSARISQQGGNIVPSQSSLLSTEIIRKRGGRGIVRENKSRALSITRYGAAYQRSRWGHGLRGAMEAGQW